MDGLLFVPWFARTRGIESWRRGTGDRRGIFRADVKALAERRNRSGDGALGEILVINVRDVVHPEAAFAERGIEIFAAQLQIQNVAEVVVGLLQLAAARYVPLKILRVSDALQIAADDRGRLIVFGDDHSVESLRAIGDINVAAHEVQQVRALQQHLRHPGVVVVAIGNVAIVAGLGLLGAHSVRNKSAERSAAETFGGNGLLHVVEPIAILILRADQDRAGRAHRRDAMAGDGAVNAEHEAIVAQNLKIVGGPIAREETFVVQHRLALIGGHREMAAETIGRPGGVAGVAKHTAYWGRAL